MGFGTGVGRRLVVLGLAVSLSGVPLSFGQTAASSGLLTGRIFVADGVTPRPGVVVKAANLSTSQVFTSTRTDKSGRYALADLPSGRYQIAVETGEGLYVNQDRVPVLQGRKTLFSLALNPASAQEEPPAPPENPPAPETPPPAENPPAPETPPPAENPPAPETPQATEPPAAEQPPAEGQPAETPKAEEKKEKGKKEKATKEEEGGKKKGEGFWRSGWGVAVGLGGGAIVLGLLADSIAGDTADVEQPPSPSAP